MITEVPLLYAKSEGRSFCYALQVGGKIKRIDDDNINSWNSNSSLEWSSENHLTGSCSVSSLKDNSAVVTLPLESKLISVIHENQRVEIDFNDLFPSQAESPLIARVQCFDYGDKQLKLLIATAKAIIYTIEILKDGLIPTNYNELSVPQLMKNHDYDYSGAELHTTMIHFTSASTAIVALSPFIFTINNIGSGNSFLSSWSLSQVEEAMATGVYSILNRAGSIMLGELDLGNSSLPPVSALSVCQNTVFTLHANATVYQWKLDDSLMKPIEVHRIDCSLPSPEDWVPAGTFSFAITSAQESADGEFIVVIHIETRNKGSNLSILQGSVSLRDSGSLIVPSDAGSVTALHLQSPIPNLVVLTTKKDEPQRKKWTQLRYIFSSKQLSRNPAESSLLTLDNVAQAEWDRLEAFEEEDIEKVDRLALQHLFLPRYPRATGTVTSPDAATVHATVAKLVPGYRWDQCKSLPVQVLCAMQHWRVNEQSSELILKNDQASTIMERGSVYESFASTKVDAMDTENDMDAVTDQIDEQHTTMAHVRRWKTFFRTILESEEKQRCPLRIENFPAAGTVIMRANLVTLLSERIDEDKKTEFYLMDEEAMNLLVKAEEKDPLKLQKAEADSMEVVTSMSLALREGREYNKILIEMQPLGFLAKKSSNISQTIRDITPHRLQTYLEYVPKEMLLPGASSQVSSSLKTDKIIVRSDIRHGAASLIVRSVDSMRRLAIGRCLLIMAYFKDQSLIQHMAFGKYLHILATLWTFSQHVPMPPSSLAGNSEDAPPMKRLSSSGSDQSGILPENSQKTTLLDAHLIQASQKISSGLLIHEAVMFLAKSIFNSMFCRSSNPTSQYMLLPELGCLPVPLKDEIASDYPRLALRLLATKIAFPSIEESSNTTMARAEATAECLLIEANHSPDSDIMRERASYYLEHGEKMDETDPAIIGEIYEKLIAAGSKITPVGDVMQAENQMMVTLQLIIYETSTSEIRKDIRRLCEKESVRNAFLPLFFNNQIPKWEISEQKLVKSLLITLLRFSNLINYLSIIERRTERLGRLGISDNQNLVAKTDSTIFEIQSLFPARMYIQLPEYVNLWSLLFRHAVAARDWKTALQSCISNPNVERKIKNFDQLIKGMVETGAMGELLDISAVVTGKSAFDFHEIATDALASGNLGNRFATGSKTPDYLGCLFCIHANSGYWKRSAQAMDLRYCDALKALESSISGTINSEMAAKDLSLSAIATCFALHLIPDHANRFLVSGDFGSTPQIALINETIENETTRSILKRGHDRHTITNLSTSPPPKDDDLSRFMTFVSLKARAIRSLAFETIFFDREAKQLPISIFSKPSPSSDRKIIDRLASLGFFPIAFLAAHAMAKYCRERFGNDMPMGRDRLHDAYTHITHTYLTTIVCKADDSSRDLFQDRPTLSQLQFCLNEISGSKMLTGSSYIACARYGSKRLILQAMRSSTAMELIRHLVLQRDQPDAPLALEVADDFLTYSDAALPKWLESCLSGDGGSNSLFGGLNGAHQHADPSALCTLYIERGRHVDACNLVSKVLLGKDNGELRKSLASSRVPEKDGLVFVPYNKIDLLWNIVDNALRRDDIDESTKSELRVSRFKMEQALEFHFNLLKISEDGLKSARALIRDD